LKLPEQESGQRVCGRGHEVKELAKNNAEPQKISVVDWGNQGDTREAVKAMEEVAQIISRIKTFQRRLRER